MEISGEVGNQGQQENSLPIRFVVSHSPKEYLRQGRVHCGVYTAKAILSAYELDTHNDPRDFHASLLGRISGAVTPQTMLKILTNHGLTAEMQTAKGLTDHEKLTTLREEIVKDKPVALMVNQGYKSDGGYSEFWKNATLHWVSVWGYDDKEQKFYLYDSAARTEQHGKSLPIGNVERTYSEVLRDWKGWALPIFERYRYITVKP